MESRLREILVVISDWLKFGEAKNAALVAVDIGIIFGLLQLLGDSLELGLVELYIMSVSAFTFVSAVLGIASFLPQVKIPWVRVLGDPASQDNLLFFGDIQKYNVETYLRSLAVSAGETRSTFSKIEQMYAEQIIVNSRIASRKYSYFRYAIWTMLTGVLTPVLSFVVYRVVREHHSD